MATITVDQQKLVLNTFAAYFQNNLLSKDLVTWKQYDSEMNDRNGLKVVEQVGPRYNTTRTTSGVVDLTTGVQDTVFGSEIFTVQDVFGSSMGWGDFVKIRDINEARESEALKNAATNMAEQIDAYILKTVQLAANNEVGTPGNNISTLGGVLAGYTRLKKEGVDDSDLRLVLAYDDKEALANTLIAYPATDSLSTGAFRKGFTGEIGGLPSMFTQQLGVLTPGTRTNGTVTGGAQNVNYSSVSVSGAQGQYLTQTLIVGGLGAAGTVNDGEIFTIANVYAYDNRKQAVQTHLQQFRVVGSFVADGAGAATIRIFPALVIPNGGANTAHATVGTAPAGGAVITFRGTASTAYMPRVIAQKSAIVMATADLIMPATGTASRKALTQLPLSVRMWQDSQFATGTHQIRFDVACTANVRDRRRIVRLNG